MRYVIGTVLLAVFAVPSLALGNAISKASKHGSVLVTALSVDVCHGMTGADRADCQLDVAEGGQR